MLKLLIGFFVVGTFCFASAQKKEYVCTPCGNSCDSKVYQEPGSCSSCHMKLIEKTSLQFKNLSADEFCNRISLDTNVVVLDVRSEGEFTGTAFRSTYGYFKNAININVEELEARMRELEKYKDREVLVYCSHSVRSPRAAMMLTQNGFQNVSNLAGGVSRLDLRDNECLNKNFVKH